MFESQNNGENEQDHFVTLEILSCNADLGTTDEARRCLSLVFYNQWHERCKPEKGTYG